MLLWCTVVAYFGCSFIVPCGCVWRADFSACFEYFLSHIFGWFCIQVIVRYCLLWIVQFGALLCASISWLDCKIIWDSSCILECGIGAWFAHGIEYIYGMYGYYGEIAKILSKLCQMFSTNLVVYAHNLQWRLLLHFDTQLLLYHSVLASHCESVLSSGLCWEQFMFFMRIAWHVCQLRWECISSCMRIDCLESSISFVHIHGIGVCPPWCC